MEKLKPCPFCGGEGIADYAYYDYDVFGVHCSKCEAYVCDYTADLAAVKWNNRIFETEVHTSEED